MRYVDKERLRCHTISFNGNSEMSELVETIRIAAMGRIKMMFYQLSETKMASLTRSLIAKSILGLLFVN